MPLTTACGRCGRLFPVYAQQLKDDRARVVCPQCGNRVDALAGLVDEPAFKGDAPPPRRRESAAAQPRVKVPQVIHRSMVPAAAPTLARVPSSPVAARDASRARVGWVSAILVLSLALGAQLAWWRRGELLRNPLPFRALITLCGYLGCQVPLVRLPGALAVLEPSLAPDPASGALMLRLSIQNNAELPQPAPLIELELFDQQGDPAAIRRFAPTEYAAAGTDQRAAALAPGETRAVSLALAPPREDASGFKIRLP